MTSKEYRDILTWVSVNLLNSKYYPIKMLEEKFDAKLFFTDFKAELRQTVTGTVLGEKCKEK